MSEQGGGSGGSGTGFDFLDRSRASRRRRGRAASTEASPGARQVEPEVISYPDTADQLEGEGGGESRSPVATVGTAHPESPSDATQSEGAGSEASVPAVEVPDRSSGGLGEQRGRSGKPSGRPSDASEVGESSGVQSLVAPQGAAETGTASTNSPQSVTGALRNDPAKQQISAYVDRTIKVRFDMRRMQDALEGGGRQAEQAEVIEMLMDFYATHGDPNAITRIQ